MHKSPSLTTIEETMPSPKGNDNYRFIGYIDLLNNLVGNEKKTHKRSKISLKRITEKIKKIIKNILKRRSVMVAVV